jgi:hypothetical protein
MTMVRGLSLAARGMLWTREDRVFHILPTQGILKNPVDIRAMRVSTQASANTTGIRNSNLFNFQAQLGLPVIAGNLPTMRLIPILDAADRQQPFLNFWQGMVVQRSIGSGDGHASKGMMVVSSV